MFGYIEMYIENKRLKKLVATLNRELGYIKTGSATVQRHNDILKQQVDNLRVASGERTVEVGKLHRVIAKKSRKIKRMKALLKDDNPPLTDEELANLVPADKVFSKTVMTALKGLKGDA